MKETERERFIRAFRRCLDENPDKAPGPSRIRYHMGLGPGYALNGRLSPLRREMLKEAGFVEKTLPNGHSIRWVKP